MAIINIKDLYEQVFRISPRYIIPNYSDLPSSTPQYGEIAIFPEPGNVAEMTELGTPILEKIILQAGITNSFKIVNGTPVLTQVSFPGYEFEGWPMIDVRQNKVLVKTQVTGRNGTVKEYISTDDHQITIRGILVGEENQYPYEAKKALQAMFDVNSPYEVSCRTLNDLGISSIIFEDREFSDIEGYENVCAYTVSAVSDSALILDIKEYKK